MKKFSRRGSNKRSYIFSAILDSLEEAPRSTSSELVDDVSKRAGKTVSSRKIGRYMEALQEKGLVVRLGPYKKIFRYNLT